MRSVVNLVLNNKVLLYALMAFAFLFTVANSKPAHAETMYNWTAPAQTNGWNNQQAYPSVVHGAPAEVRTGWDMYNVQTGQNTGMTVHAQNVSPVAFTTTICAEQWTNGIKQHLGCVPEAPFPNAAAGVSRFDFNVWPANNMAGTHSIMFTYRDSMGNWREMRSPTYQQYRPMIGT
jgi:hypothetical protein